MLQAANVRKEFGGLVAVDGVDLEIDEGEIVGLIGPNGAGKTTLFNTITGVLKPEEGTEISFNGTDLVPLDTHEIARAGVLRTFQIVRVFDEMTVFENALAGAMFGTDESVSREEAEERARDALEFVGLADSAGVEAGSLPIAKQKQLELARTVASRPDLLLLDEIASGLTPAEIEELSDTIRRLRDERGISVFWIEHIMDAIMGTADRIIVLSSGRKIADGTPEEIRNDEAVTEAYLGSSEDDPDDDDPADVDVETGADSDAAPTSDPEPAVAEQTPGGTTDGDGGGAPQTDSDATTVEEEGDS
jgi:branched-chain amino acid transport system ATP-binding protein